MARVNPAEKLARIRAALPEMRAMAAACRVCGRGCGVDRTGPAAGYCRAASEAGFARCSAALRHFGEEPMLVGRGGSGTIFFSHCNLRCAFCQNHQISHGGEGREHSTAELAAAMLRLRDEGAENINLVTPTHYALPVLGALEAAFAAGLDLPVVWNTNGYDAAALVALLDGIVDVWLPDVKHTEPEAARRYSGAENYPETARAAVSAMWRQAGPLLCDSDGTARRGVILRHLVLPEDASGTYAFLLWLQEEGMTDVTLSLMSQYSPQYRAAEYPEIARSLTPKEYDDAVDFALRLGFGNLLVQEMESSRVYLPDFQKDRPFSQ